MDGSSYQTVYDITRTLPPIHEIMLWLGGLAFGVLIIAFILLKKSNKTTKLIATIFCLFWCISWIVLGGIGWGNVVYQYYTCVNWVKSGNYSVVTGNVTNFDPMPYTGHKLESFTINGLYFEYSDYDLSKCGFNQTSSHGGPISDGLPVKISYKDGRILILEVEKRIAP